MTEVRRFLRYTLPGISYVLQLLIALAISNTDELKPLLQSNDAAQSLGIVVGGFIASGGLGNLFATVYFLLYWCPPVTRVVAPNHRSIWNDIAQHVEITAPNGSAIRPNELSPREAWLLTNCYWFSRLETETAFKGVNPTVDRLVNVMHGLGATFIGTFAAIVSWLCFSVAVFHNCFDWDMFIELVVWLGFLTMIAVSRIPVVKAIQGLVNSCIVEDIHKRKSNESQKVKIWFAR